MTREITGEIMFTISQKQRTIPGSIERAPIERLYRAEFPETIYYGSTPRELAEQIMAYQNEGAVVNWSNITGRRGQVVVTTEQNIYSYQKHRPLSDLEVDEFEENLSRRLKASHKIH